ncbi:hypothetical protein [Fusibacter bizertensis]
MAHKMKDNTYSIENYDQLPTFSSFLPGICGVHGVPLWAFYVNRGQGIASFGMDDKDHAMMEFSPAVIAYEDVTRKGFRTFIKTEEGPFEAFSTDLYKANEVVRTMYIHENSLEIEEQNFKFGLVIKVMYHMLPESLVGAMVRTVTIENTRNHQRKLEILDGMARIIPYGIANSEFKEMANLLKSFSSVTGIGGDTVYFATRATVSDREEVEAIKGSYFYFTNYNGQNIKPICDANLVFGHDSSLGLPLKFYTYEQNEIAKHKQNTDNKIPCAFSPIAMLLEPNGKEKFTSYIGYATGAVPYDLLKGKDAGAADEIVSNLTKEIWTHTSHPVFDAYMRQCYLDNLLRGGYPYVMSAEKSPVVIQLYSRKHGDLERDYNFFKTESVHYSQGNGNFRDVCQNRRDTVFFHPEIDDFDIMTFANLIQIDGYNPLEILPTRFKLKEDLRNNLSNDLPIDLIKFKLPDVIITSMRQGFTPGDLFRKLQFFCPERLEDNEKLIEELISYCEAEQCANYKEGYWIDHWTYIIHLVKSYLEVFPERESELFYGKKTYKFYDSPAYVQPRILKYGLKDNKVVQFGATIVDPLKIDRPNQTHWLSDENKDTIYATLFVKLFHLAVIKCLTLDAKQIGLEMEAGKPGWNDAFNGLPGLLGSSISETFDLAELIDLLVKILEAAPQKFEMPCMIYELGVSLSELCTAKISAKLSEFEFWDHSSDLREAWRIKTQLRLSSKTVEVLAITIKQLLLPIQALVEEALKKAEMFGDIVPTYLTYDAIDYVERQNSDGTPMITPYGLKAVKVKAFVVNVLPLFLEAPSKQLKRLGRSKAESLYEAIKKSDLYDEKLQMYKISQSLETLGVEVGRIRAFTPGWFERESIFLHMSYKYMLSLIESDLNEAFFETMQTGCVPFFNPEVYGRSLLENSSFIASSANPDETIHGRGYIARLSGSTAEMISLWKRMFIGSSLFKIEAQKLIFEFGPKLPGWLFDNRGKIEFTCFDCKITYINEKRRDTFGEQRVRIHEIRHEGKTISQNSCLPETYARLLREKALTSLEVYLS